MTVLSRYRLNTPSTATKRYPLAESETEKSPAQDYRAFSARTLIERAASLNRNTHNGRRAAHKPLLLLWALARFARGDERLPFAAVEPAVGALLRTFGPPHRTSPDYPFWHLQNDGLWVVEDADVLPPGRGQTKPLITTLRDRDAVGRLAPGVTRLLREQPALLDEFVRVVLGYFPLTYHADLLQVVGLDPSHAVAAREPLVHYTPRRPRDPRFRERVLDAYKARCAVCGFSATLGTDLVGVEAAHIQWHSEAGPDDMPNGLALCSLHHTLFDRGAFTLSVEQEPRVSVAQRVAGTGSFDSLLLDLHGRPVQRPQRDEDAPAEPFLQWHNSEVFRAPARPSAMRSRS